MSVHPKFDAESGCHNCAAFLPDQPIDPMHNGECHRHAPQPVIVLCKENDDGEEIDHANQSRTFGASWPIITDNHFCLDWFPKPDAKPAE